MSQALGLRTQLQRVQLCLDAEKDKNVSCFSKLLKPPKI